MNKFALALIGAAVSVSVSAAPKAAGGLASLSTVTAIQTAFILLPVALFIGVTAAAESGNNNPTAPAPVATTGTTR